MQGASKASLHGDIAVAASQQQVELTAEQLRLVAEVLEQQKGRG
jgi:hypothetical protein